MRVEIQQVEAFGRVIAAGRMLAGLDQAQLGEAAGVSAATVSNVERGNDAREETRKAIRKALKQSGVSILFDPTNGLISATLTFNEPDDED